MGELDRSDLAALPKVELHVHLEGSVRASTAARLARRHGEDPDEVLVLEDGRYPDRFRDFEHFLRTFLATSRQLRSPADLRTAAADFARHQRQQNVRWCEVTFTARTHVAAGMDPDEMWEAVTEGLAEVPEVGVGLIVDAVRDLGVAHAQATVALVEGAVGWAPIVALGLAGIEGSAAEREFRVLRDAADRLGLGLAVHAGETGGPEQIRATIDDLGADRIGHGIAVVRDRVLMERAADLGIPFEVCPSSNVRLGIVDRLEDHPLPAMLDAGLAVTVNSDDPPFFSTTLTDELWHAVRLCGLDREGLAELQRRAVGAAFVDEPVRRTLLDGIDAWASGGA